MAPVKKREVSTDDDDDSDSDMVGKISRNIKVGSADIIQLSSDDDEEDLKSSKTERTSRAKRQRRAIDYREDSDDDKMETDEKGLVYLNIRNIVSYLAKFRTQKAMGKYPHVQIANQPIDDLAPFNTYFKKQGKNIHSLHVSGISAELLRLIGTSCPKLETLSIGWSYDANPYMPKRIQFQFCSKLKTLSLEGPNRFLESVPATTKLLQSVSAILESLQINYHFPRDFPAILESMNKTHLKKLKSFVIKYNSSDSREDIVLRQTQFRMISRYNLPNLERLAFICGIGEDVTGRDLEKLLLQFAPTLKHFTLAGNLLQLVSTTDDDQQRIKVPPMPFIESFNFGSIYEFDEEACQVDEVTRDGSRSDVKPLTNNAMLITVEFPFLPKLQTLCLGNMVNIYKLSPKLFPDLRTLRITSTWTVEPLLSPQAVNSVADLQFPEFPLVRDLQLPDCMVDEFFVSKILEMFPNVKKVKMNLPSAKCLRYFFHAMQKSALQSLQLKTSFDFKGILEYTFFGQSYAARDEVNDDESHNQLLKLKDYSVNGNETFDEFIRFYGIELPVANIDDDECAVIREGTILDLIHLETLEIEHIPRTIRIPLDPKIPHNHSKQQFHPHLTLGFKEYPLDQKFFSTMRRLRNLQKFTHGSNMINVTAPRDTQAQNQCDWNQVENRSNSDSGISMEAEQDEHEETENEILTNNDGEEESTQNEEPPSEPEPEVVSWTRPRQLFKGSGKLPQNVTNLKRKVSRRAAMVKKEPKIKMEKVDANENRGPVGASPLPIPEIKIEKLKSRNSKNCT